MFNNLVESASHGDEFKRRGSFFAGALGVYALLFTAIGIGSVFAYDAHLEKQQLELVSLLTPVEEAPPDRPQPANVRRSSNLDNTKPHPATRVSPPPSDNPTLVNKGVAAFSKQSPPAPYGWEPGRTNTNGVPDAVSKIGPTGPGGPGKPTETPETGPPPPSAHVDPNPTDHRRSIIVSKGPVNGMAVSLPKPVYPRVAVQAGVAGTVVVQVLIDEKGKVISAKAISGNPLLLSAAVNAAYQARFTPTTLSEVPVKVSGVINYNFQKQ
jgi:protein TonB